MYALVLFSQSRTYGTLPDPGGLQDQEVEWLADFALINGVLAEEAEKKERRRGKK